MEQCGGLVEEELVVAPWSVAGARPASLAASGDATDYIGSSPQERIMHI